MLFYTHGLFSLLFRSAVDFWRWSQALHRLIPSSYRFPRTISVINVHRTTNVSSWISLSLTSINLNLPLLLSRSVWRSSVELSATLKSESFGQFQLKALEPNHNLLKQVNQSWNFILTELWIITIGSTCVWESWFGALFFDFSRTFGKIKGHKGSVGRYSNDEADNFNKVQATWSCK